MTHDGSCGTHTHGFGGAKLAHDGSCGTHTHGFGGTKLSHNAVGAGAGA